jgi:hypothetical protein
LTHAGISNGLIGGKSTLVKYGASYYIDGGDKGTVKLLSKSSDYAKNVAYSALKTNAVAGSISSNYLSLSNTVFNVENRDQLIGSYLKSDTTMTVIWTTVDPTNPQNTRLYFNKSTAAFQTNSSIELIVPRRQRSMVSLRARDEVSNTTGTAIRNRIQLYPIKYGIGVTDPTEDKNILTINFIKNPLLITNNLNNSTLPDQIDVEIYSNISDKTRGFILGSGTIPREIISSGEENISSSHYQTLNTYLPSDGSYMHCYVRGRETRRIITGFDPNSVSGNETPILVRIFKKDGKIYVQNYSSKNESFNIYGYLLPVKMYTFDSTGNIQTFSGQFTHNQYEDQKKWNETERVGTFETVAQLSGASVSQDFRLSPVANTGSIIFSLYTNNGGSQYDLTDYFAYNKEYVSYPLTNEVDILCAYAMWESTSASSQPTQSLSIVNSLTWEEQ